MMAMNLNHLQEYEKERGKVFHFLKNTCRNLKEIRGKQVGKVGMGK